MRLTEILSLTKEGRVSLEAGERNPVVTKDWFGKSRSGRMGGR